LGNNAQQEADVHTMGDKQFLAFAIILTTSFFDFAYYKNFLSLSIDLA